MKYNNEVMYNEVMYNEMMYNEVKNNEVMYGVSTLHYKGSSHGTIYYNYDDRSLA